MKMKWFVLTETKLFHFHEIFKEGGGGLNEPFEPPLDPPLHLTFPRLEEDSFCLFYQLNKYVIKTIFSHVTQYCLNQTARNYESIFSLKCERYVF